MAFFDIILAFPTVVYSVLLSLALLYWGFVIAGVMDLDMFDFDLDFDIDVGVDIDVDVDVDADLDVDADGAVHAGPGFFVTILTALGIGKVPFMIVFSAIVFIAWIVSYLTAAYVLPLLDHAAWAQALVFAGSFLVALPVSTVVTRPMRDVFQTTTKDSGKKLVGMSVMVLTGSVDNTFGQGKLDDGGADLVINIRCDVSNNGLKKGSEALVIGYDDQTNVYHVEPMEELLLASNDVELQHGDQEVVETAAQVAKTVE